MNAQDILEAGIGHMMDRAATYDKPQGERSMAATVEAFRAVSGVTMTEEQGWLFMLLLKAVRSQQGAYRAGSYEDGAAYFALAGECAYNTRRQVERHPITPNVVSYPAVEVGVDTRFDQLGRQEVVEQNGNDAAAYIGLCDKCIREMKPCSGECSQVAGAYRQALVSKLTQQRSATHGR